MVCVQFTFNNGGTKLIKTLCNSGYSKYYRGFRALQEREPGPRPLLEGGSKGDTVRDRPVSTCATHQCFLFEQSRISSITKMRENCGKQFDAHWECLERKNHVCHLFRSPFSRRTRLVNWLANVQDVSLASTSILTPS